MKERIARAVISVKMKRLDVCVIKGSVQKRKTLKVVGIVKNSAAARICIILTNMV